MTMWHRFLSIWFADSRRFRRWVGGRWFLLQLSEREGKRSPMWFHEEQAPPGTWDVTLCNIESYPPRMP